MREGEKVGKVWYRNIPFLKNEIIFVDIPKLQNETFYVDGASK